MRKLSHTSDIMTLIADSHGQTGIILTEQDVDAKLFDLRSGLAGELFQKMVNYNKRLALVVQDTAAYSPRFQELVYEHATHPYIRFFTSRADAELWLGEGSDRK